MSDSGKQNKCLEGFSTVSLNVLSVATLFKSLAVSFVFFPLFCLHAKAATTARLRQLNLIYFDSQLVVLSHFSSKNVQHFDSKHTTSFTHVHSTQIAEPVQSNSHANECEPSSIQCTYFRSLGVFITHSHGPFP